MIHEVLCIAQYDESIENHFRAEIPNYEPSGNLDTEYELSPTWHWKKATPLRQLHNT